MKSPASAELVSAIAAGVRGEPVGFDEWAPGEVLDAAVQHGVAPLLAERLDPRWPSAIQTALRKERALGAALEALRRRETVRVLDALGSSGIQPLLVKGSALAHTLYPDPSLRPRFDTDLLIRRSALDRIARVMTDLGYHRPAQVTGDLVMHQVDYVRRDASGLLHVFDFHWKISNRQAVAEAVTYDEMMQASEPIPALCPGARGPNGLHSLLLACVHRVAHHSTDERLIWLVDIDRLLRALTAGEIDRFVALARARSVSLICADGLRAAQLALRTPLPDGSLERLMRAGGGHDTEPSAALLTGDPTLARELLSDLKAVGWPQRLRLLREHAFPSAHFMRTAYGTRADAWLPALYTHRIVRGAWRLLRGAAR